MTWTFERVFYGSKDGLNLRSMRDFLMRGYYLIPHTLFNGYYRAVNRVGDYESIYTRVKKPFPDLLLAQRPEGRFALHLSGGFDSSILAKLYDRQDVDYIHFTGPESVKARALAATLKGTLHEIQIRPELYIEAADEFVSRLPEPARRPRNWGIRWSCRATGETTFSGAPTSDPIAERPVSSGKQSIRISFSA